MIHVSLFHESMGNTWITCEKHVTPFQVIDLRERGYYLGSIFGFDIHHRGFILVPKTSHEWNEG